MPPIIIVLFFVSIYTDYGRNRELTQTQENMQTTHRPRLTSPKISANQVKKLQAIPESKHM